VFGCLRCSVPWTVPLRRAPDCFEHEAHDRCVQVPPGTWRSEPNRNRPDAPVVVGPDAVRSPTFHPDAGRRVGCCGVAYRAGKPNLLCPGCGMEAGYLLMDGDHVPWSAAFPSHVLEQVSAERASDEEVASQLRAFDGLVHAAKPGRAFPMSEADFVRDWHEGRDLLAREPFMDDPECLGLEDVPELGEFELVPQPGGRMAMVLDGHTTFLPWPASEVRRSLALQSFMRGSAEETSYLYVDHPVCEGGLREEWSDWRLEGQLLVMWERRLPQTATYRAFRLPLSAWADAWKLALERLPTP
jgi:hypothetical protein